MKEEIQKLEQEQRELAEKQSQLSDRIAELSKPKPKWQKGDVEQVPSGRLFLVTDDECTVALSSYDCGVLSSKLHDQNTNLGKHSEVFILRSEVEKEYIKKSEVKRICSIKDLSNDSILATMSNATSLGLSQGAVLGMRTELAKHGITAD